MGIKLIKKTNEAEHKKFDFSITDEDAQKFDFINLNSRLQQFRGWLEDLQVKVNAPTPTMGWSARGSSGFCYRIANDANGRDEVDVDIRCGTNPAEYPEFHGGIYAGGRIFKIKNIDDLTDQLIDDIVAAVKGFKGEAAGDGLLGDYICTKSFAHGNMGRVCTKGKQYSVTEILPDGRVMVGGWRVDPEFLKSHFKKVEG